MSIVYSNPIASTTEIRVGDAFFLHANPKLKKLEPGDIVNVKLETEADPYGRAVILPHDTVGPNTYHAKRIE